MRRRRAPLRAAQGELGEWWRMGEAAPVLVRMLLLARMLLLER